MTAARLLLGLALGSASLLSAATSARPQSSTLVLKAPPDFDLAAQMNALYGNYDSAHGLSVFVRPSNEGGGKLNVRAFFVAAIPDSSNKEVLLATFALPEGEENGFPDIAAALFEDGTKGWSLKASELPSFMFSFGEKGEPPKASIVRFGPHQYGIKLEFSGFHMGVASTETALFLPWNGKFVNALNQPTMADSSEDGHGCGTPPANKPEDEGLPPCYVYHRTLEFVPGKDPEYYDLLIKTTGTGVERSEPMDANGIVHLHFVNGKYLADPLPRTSIIVTP